MENKTENTPLDSDCEIINNVVIKYVIRTKGVSWIDEAVLIDYKDISDKGD